MKANKKTYLLAMSCIFLGTALPAQVRLSTLTTNSGGNFFKNSTIQIESSIGEMMAINTSFNSDLIVSKGVLQPQRLRTDHPAELRDFKIYPTLTSGNFVFLTGTLDQSAVFTVRILNNIGQMISQKHVPVYYSRVNEIIRLPDHIKGTLFIEVITTTDGGIVNFKKTFPIQKL